MRVLLLSASLLLACSALAQQTPAADAAPVGAAPVRTTSMGMPPTLKPYVFGAADWDRQAGALGGDLTVGVYRDLVTPIVGLGVSLEGTVGWTGGDEGGVTSGARVFGSALSAALQVGGEVRFDERALDLVVSALPPLRRGGPLGQGGALRIDWIPTRGHSFRVGLTMPVGQPWRGQTRPRHDAVPLPRAPRETRPAPLAAGVEASLRQAAEGAYWLATFSHAFGDNSGGGEAAGLETFRASTLAWRDSLRASGPEGPGLPTFAQAEADYHSGIEAAFAQATGAGPSTAGEVAGAARAALLADVLIPYDRLIGQPKRNDSLRGFFPAARARFGRWLADSSGVDTGAHAATLAAFDGVLNIAEATRSWTHDHWRGDSREVWLPLQLGMRPEEHDEQDELTDLVGRVVGRPFTSGNLALPINNTWFFRDLVASIHEARSYHVLWIHDYVGTNPAGRPDTTSYQVTTAGYIDALTEAVRRYDETRTIPTFMVFLDPKSYDASQAGVWFDVLEDPLGRPASVPGSPAMEAGVRRAQDALRAAVAGSARLQADAAEQGRGWLRGVVKVHLSGTFPPDFSFRSSNLISWWPGWADFPPDDLMRDHRKVAFYDITERDPRLGRALFVGTGVGDKYVSATWEDRGVMTTGPALVELKDQARYLLLSQGFSEGEIPPPLRAEPRPPNYDALVAELAAAGADADALNVHNRVGYAEKEATLAQATLYTMMPAGCVIYVPDSLWLSAFWTGQLVGAAFRGCSVRVIAPALANAPSAAGPVMARARSMVSRMLIVQTEMADVFAAAGGDFRVGLYTRTSAVEDLPALLRESAPQFEQGSFMRREIPFPDAVYDLLLDTPDQLDAAGFAVAPLVEDVADRQPNLHRKTQFLAMRPVMDAIAAGMDVETIRSGLVQAARGSMMADSVRGTLATRAAAAYPMVSRVDLLSPALRDRAVFFSLVGSMNKDARSLMLDGETLHVVAGPWAMVHYPDFALLLGRVTWVERQAQIDALIPPYGAVERRLSRLLRDVL